MSYSNFLNCLPKAVHSDPVCCGVFGTELTIFSGIFILTLVVDFIQLKVFFPASPLSSSFSPVSTLFFP